MFGQMPQPETPQLKGFAKVKAELLQEIEYLKKQYDLSNNQCDNLTEQLSIKCDDILTMCSLNELLHNEISEKDEYINLLELRLKQIENA